MLPSIEAIHNNLPLLLRSLCADPGVAEAIVLRIKAAWEEAKEIEAEES